MKNLYVWQDDKRGPGFTFAAQCGETRLLVHVYNGGLVPGLGAVWEDYVVTVIEPILGDISELMSLGSAALESIETSICAHIRGLGL